ncbi:MAG: YncE family protein [Polyangiaceae bacterium]
MAFAGCKSCKGTDTAPAELVPIATDRAAYVTDNVSDQITVIDRESADVLSRSIDIDKTAHEAPHHLAVDPRARRLFVALTFPAPPDPEKKGPHSGHGNASNNGKLAKLDLATLSVQAIVDVDENPGDVVLTHDGTKVLVTHFDMRRAMVAATAGRPPNEMFATIQVWDTTSMKKIGSRAICVAPHGIAVSSDDKTAIVACYGSDEIALVDLTQKQLPTSRFVLGATEGVLGAPKYGPYSADPSPDNSRILVGDLESKDVRIFDLATKKFADPIAVGSRAFIGAFLDDATAIVPLQAPDGLVKIDTQKNSVLARVSLSKDQCEAPHMARVDSKHRVFVVCEGDHVSPGAVIEVDPTTLAVIKRWVTGIYPDGIAFGD